MQHNGVVGIDHEGFGYGMLECAVVTKAGTARRNDKIPSWEDEDAKSGSTHFNSPTPSVGSSSSLAARISGGGKGAK